MKLIEIVRELQEYYPLRDIKVAYQMIKKKEYDPIEGLFLVLDLTEHKFSNLPKKPTREDIVSYTDEFIYRKTHIAEVLY